MYAYGWRLNEDVNGHASSRRGSLVYSTSPHRCSRVRWSVDDVKNQLYDNLKNLIFNLFRLASQTQSLREHR